MSTEDKKLMAVLDIIGPQYLSTKEIHIIQNTPGPAEKSANKILALRKREDKDHRKNRY